MAEAGGKEAAALGVLEERALPAERK